MPGFDWIEFVIPPARYCLHVRCPCQGHGKGCCWPEALGSPTKTLINSVTLWFQRKNIDMCSKYAPHFHKTYVHRPLRLQNQIPYLAPLFAALVHFSVIYPSAGPHCCSLKQGQWFWWNNTIWLSIRCNGVLSRVSLVIRVKDIHRRLCFMSISAPGVVRGSAPEIPQM